MEMGTYQITIERLRWQLELASQYILSEIRNNHKNDGFMKGFALACKEECDRITIPKIEQTWDALMAVMESSWMFIHSFESEEIVNYELFSLFQKDLEKAHSIVHPDVISKDA